MPSPAQRFAHNQPYGGIIIDDQNSATGHAISPSARWSNSLNTVRGGCPSRAY